MFLILLILILNISQEKRYAAQIITLQYLLLQYCNNIHSQQRY